jgi:hypothetical protein
MTDERTLQTQAFVRLDELREELANAEQLEHQLVVQRAHVHERWLRLRGGIDALEDLVADEQEAAELSRASA